MVIFLERGADLHMAQLMPLPLTVSCFSKIQTGFTFLVPADPGSPGKRAVKWVYVCIAGITDSNIGLQCAVFSHFDSETQSTWSLSGTFLLAPLWHTAQYAHESVVRVVICAACSLNNLPAMCRVWFQWQSAVFKVEENIKAGTVTVNCGITEG